MKRMSIAILIALFAAFAINTHVFAARDSVNVNLFMADFDGKTGTFYGAWHDLNNNNWHAIAWDLEIGTANEDDMGIAQDERNRIYNVAFTVDSSYSFDYLMVVNNKTFAWRNLDDSDIGTISGVNTTCTGMIEGFTNGDYTQFNSYVVNGPMFLLKEADPFTQGDARGWLTQNGNLVSFVVGNGESPSTTTPTNHLYVALMLH